MIIKSITCLAILLIISCSIFYSGPDPNNIEEWVNIPEIGIKLNYEYSIPLSGQSWEREYTLSYIYTDDTLQTLYYTYFNDSDDGDVYYGKDTLFITINYSQNSIYFNHYNPQINGHAGFIIIQAPIKNGAEFDSNWDPFTVHKIVNTDTTYNGINEEFSNIIYITDQSYRFFSMDLMMTVYQYYEYYEANIVAKLISVE